MMSYQKILVAIDDSETSTHVLNEAKKLIKITHSQVLIVKVLALDPIIADEYIKLGQTNELIKRAWNYLMASLEQAKQSFAEDHIDAEIKLLEGFSISDEIIKAAQEFNADLIVMGSHGRTGLSKLLLGSVAQKVLGESHIPVLVVR